MFRQYSECHHLSPLVASRPAFVAWFQSVVQRNGTAVPISRSLDAHCCPHEEAARWRVICILLSVLSFPRGGPPQLYMVRDRAEKAVKVGKQHAGRFISRIFLYTVAHSADVGATSPT